MHLSERFLTEPWHIHPQAIVPMLQRHATWGPKLQAAEDPQRISIADFIHQRQPMAVTGEGVALVEICGCLGRGLVNIDKLLGDTDYDDVIGEVASAAANPLVKSIVLLVNSGGGSVLGAQECREAVLDAAAKKPVVAYTAGFMCSAAYEICAGASLLMASPSAIVGSIGTITTRLDVSAYWEAMGVKIHVIPATASDLKASYWPEAQLTDAQRANIQAFVDRWNDDFLAFVRTCRLDVEADSMRGQAFGAQEALDRGLLDHTGSVDDALDQAIALGQ